MAAKAKLTPTDSLFASLTSDTAKGLVLTPPLKAFLYNAEYPDAFNVPFDRVQTRKVDGLFHPSEHPLMGERLLYFFARHPQHIIPERLQPWSTLSVTMGKALHEFIAMCLQSLGLLLTPEEMIAEGIPYDEKLREPYVFDPVTGETGHMDGISKAKMLDLPHLSRQHFEFKTTNQRKLAKFEDLDLELFRLTWPEYYAQAQAYLRMSGYRMTIVVVMALGHPWPMREFHIPYDEDYALSLEAKYLRVRAAVRDDEASEDRGYDNLPEACCTPRSGAARECPAREMCPVGRVA